jgi:hypothetical protein
MLRGGSETGSQTGRNLHYSPSGPLIHDIHPVPSAAGPMRTYHRMVGCLSMSYFGHFFPMHIEMRFETRWDLKEKKTSWNLIIFIVYICSWINICHLETKRCKSTFWNQEVFWPRCMDIKQGCNYTVLNVFKIYELLQAWWKNLGKIAH